VRSNLQHNEQEDFMIKRLTLAATLLLAASTMLAAGPANYAGAWSLSKSESRNLPKNYDIVKSAHLKVAQDQTTFSIGVTIDAEGRPEYKQDFAYPLDGSVKQTESTVRTPDGPLQVPTTLAAAVMNDGALELTETRTISRDGVASSFGSTEVWKLSEDGKVLTVHRTDHRPQGIQEYDMVFHRE
jgi:hypothetical protein